MSRALYKILVDDILRKISSGDILVGERLPPEAEYAESLGVSRSTLRQAFSRLEHSGIIKRRKRGGTEVISSKPVQHFNMVTNDFYDVFSVARDTLLTVTDISEVATGTVKDLANYDSADATLESWLVCAGSRFMAGQGEPFADLKVYVPKQYSDIDLQVGDTTGSVLVKIQDRYGVAAGRVKRQISADICNDDIAAKLGLTAGDAVLTILTEVDDKRGHLLEVARSIVDPARFNVSTDVMVGD